MSATVSRLATRAGPAADIQAASTSLDRILSRLGTPRCTIPSRAAPLSPPDPTLPPSHRDLLERISEARDQAHQLQTKARSTKVRSERDQIMQERLRTCGKAIGDLLVQSVRMRSLSLAQSAFDTYAEQFRPQSFHYNAVLGLVARDAPADAWTFYKDMIDKKVTPDLRTMATMFNLIGRTADLARYRHLATDMAQYRVRPDLITCSSMVVALIKCNAIKDAQDLFSDMTRKYGVRPDHILYSIMIEQAARQKDAERCRALLAAMKADGIQHDQRLRLVIDANRSLFA